MKKREHEKKKYMKVLTLSLKCAASAFKGMTLVGRTFCLSPRVAAAADGGTSGGGTVAVSGAVVVATLLDAVVVTDADRCTLLGRCLTT